jgi:hypothetical protein
MTFTTPTIKPWEAFGVSDDATAPNVRLCLNGDVPADWEPPPEDEVHQGVIMIRITIYGDDPSSAFIHVHGLEEDAVRAKWLNAQKVWSWTKVHDQIWRPR